MTISPTLTPGVLESREPLGRILLVCGPDCSTELVADHLQAALAGGNSLVVAVLTALHVVVADDRRRHGRRTTGRGPTNALLRLLTTPNTLSKEATK
jgi:hypothetical protein